MVRPFLFSKVSPSWGGSRGGNWERFRSSWIFSPYGGIKPHSRSALWPPVFQNGICSLPKFYSTLCPGVFCSIGERQIPTKGKCCSSNNGLVGKKTIPLGKWFFFGGGVIPFPSGPIPPGPLAGDWGGQAD